MVYGSDFGRMLRTAHEEAAKVTGEGYYYRPTGDFHLAPEDLVLEHGVYRPISYRGRLVIEMCLPDDTDAQPGRMRT